MTLPVAWPGKIYAAKDAAALASILGDLGAEVRFNTRSTSIEIQVPPPLGSGAWQPFHDRNVAWLRDFIGKNCVYRLGNGGEARLSYGIDSFADCLNVLAATREVDPFEVWLEELPFWDGEPRIDSLLCDLFGAEDLPLVRWAGGSSRWVLCNAPTSRAANSTRSSYWSLLRASANRRCSPNCCHRSTPNGSPIRSSSMAGSKRWPRRYSAESSSKRARWRALAERTWRASKLSSHAATTAPSDWLTGAIRNRCPAGASSSAASTALSACRTIPPV